MEHTKPRAKIKRIAFPQRKPAKSEAVISKKQPEANG